MKQAQLGWWEHTREEREAWDDFAATIPSRAKDIGRRAKRVRRRAYRLYISAQLNRLGMGLPVTGQAPVRKCTHLISDVELVAAPQAGQMAFRLFHHGNRPEGIRVLVEMTRGTKHDRRKPLKRELTRAGITDAGSYFPLAQNGATYVLEQRSPERGLESRLQAECG